MIWFFLTCYTVLFIGLVSLIGFTRRRERKSRKPFAENLRLLRGPGESTRKRTEALAEEIQSQLMVFFGMPLIVGLLLIGILNYVAGPLQTALIIGCLLGLVAGLLIEIRKLMRNRQQLRNCYLGYFGERVVAEAIDPLKYDGFVVFHDVPVGDANAPFNLDHVVVGSSGVFAIETKTRRKGRARDGFADHQIIFDGQVLSYPWAEDRHGLDQALRQAKWLKEWLGQLLGANIPVQPILTFPGWMILRRAKGAVTVLNPREIPSAVALRGAPVLTADQIDLVARQLDARCRDVEF
ncbi:MAG: nuclease-related domain-containing protein [Opitutaceae bacterium]|jgi:F0F1-type ATP synthase assembly protein I